MIRESTSPWASPIVLVAKKDGGVRPCVDYRKQLVKPDGFPLPRIQDCLDSVAGSSLFSTFDLTSGYFQIPVKREDVPKTSVVCKYGQFEMTRMPFCLNNSASTFQRTTEMALQGLQWVTLWAGFQSTFAESRGGFAKNQSCGVETKTCQEPHAAERSRLLRARSIWRGRKTEPYKYREDLMLAKAKDSEAD